MLYRSALIRALGFLVVLSWLVPASPSAETVEIIADDEVVSTPTPVMTETPVPVPTDTPPPVPTDTPTVRVPTPTFSPTEPPSPEPTVILSTPTFTPKPKPRLEDDEEEKQARREAEEDAAAEARAAREAARRKAELESVNETSARAGSGKSTSVSKGTGFDFMVRSGMVVRKKSQIERFGQVVGGPNAGEISYSVPKSVYVKLRKGVEARTGDRWVVLRFGGSIRDTVTGKYLGTQVLHQAVGTVVEVQAGRCLVKLTQSFGPVQVGDEVKSYEDEIERWRQARKRSELPAGDILCHVCGGDPATRTYQMNDYVILSAGSDSGVVAGQVFQLRQRDSGPGWSGPAETTIGRVRVFTVGPQYSIAKILMNSYPIAAGTRAVYKP